MTIIGKLICKLTGTHKRGKRTDSVFQPPAATWLIAYQCPRCGATWSRTSKARPPSNIPTSIKKAAP